MKFLIIQVLGFAGCGAAMISAQFRTRKTMLLFQLVSCILWVAHYGMLGAMTGAVSGVLSLVRVLLFSLDTKCSRHPVCLVAILCACGANAVLTWAGIESLFAGLASCFTTIALWSKDMKHTRRWLLLDSPCWFLYDAMTCSVSGMILEGVAFVSYLLAIYRLDRTR